MPDKDVGVDPNKLIPNEQYEEHIAERPNLRRRPGMVVRKNANEEEKVHHVGK